MADKKATSSNKKSTVHRTSTVEATASTTGSVLLSYKKFYKSLKRTPIIGVMLAEFIGTFLLVASIFTVQGQPLFVAFVLIGVVLVVGGVSGAHVNPAMTIGAWATRKISALYALGYIAAQVLGAVVAWLVLNAFLGGAAASATGARQSLFHAATLTGGKEWYIFFAELLGATILAFGLATALNIKREKIAAAFSYGLAILVALLVAGSVTSMYLTESNTGLTFLNPATAIAANGLSWNLWPIAIYIFAPVIGGIVGFALQDFLQSQTDDSCDCCCDIKK
jgi:glycerol uptake facilitator-like aquaporin